MSTNTSNPSQDPGALGKRIQIGADIAGMPTVGAAPSAARTAQPDIIYTALMTAVEKVPTVNDMLVHQGGTIWFKSARRTQKISDVFDVRGTPLENRVITDHDITYFLVVHVMGAKTKEQVEIVWARIVQEIKSRGSFSESIRLGWGCKGRVQLFRHGKGHWALNVRVSASVPPTIDNLGLPQPVVPVLRSAQRGLILLTGPMSSGKTTTAQSLLNHHNLTRSGHIVTIEDPIETDLRPAKCLISAKEVGVDCTSFSAGLHDALRQAVDVMLIGELRDADTIRTALSAAASGILVIATTHGDTCTGAISRMMTLLGTDSGGYYKVLSQSLVCVIRQAMVPSIDGDRWYTASDALIPTEGGNIANLLGEGKISSIESEIAGDRPGAAKRQPEWVSMNETLLQLVRNNKVSITAAKQASTNPRAFTNA